MNVKYLTAPRLKWMDYVGCNPKNQTKYRRLLCQIFVILICISILLSAINLMTAKYNSTASFVMDILLTTGFWQVRQNIKISDLLYFLLNCYSLSSVFVFAVIY